MIVEQWSYDREELIWVELKAKHLAASGWLIAWPRAHLSIGAFWKSSEDGFWHPWSTSIKKPDELGIRDYMVYERMLKTMEKNHFANRATYIRRVKL